MKSAHQVFLFFFSRAPLYTVLALLFALSAGAGYASEPSPHSGQLVQVELDEWRIKLNIQTVLPGKVVFKAWNKGSVAHEMVVIKTDLSASGFEVAGGKVKEDAVGKVMGEIEGFPPNTEETLTLNLEKGNYVLFCNNLEKGKAEGHYQRGMRVVFTVK